MTSRASFTQNPANLLFKNPVFIKSTVKQSKNKNFDKYCSPFSPKNKKNNFPQFGISIQRYASQQQLFPLPPVQNEYTASGFCKSKDWVTIVKNPNADIFQQQIKYKKIKDNSFSKKITILKSTTSTSSADTRRISKQEIPSFLKQKQQQNGFNIMRNNQTFELQNFKIIKKLGSGKFGKVFMAKQYKTGFVVALKVIEKQKIIQGGHLEQFIKQLKLQSFLNHENITKLFGFFSDKKYFYTLMQLGCDGQLYNYVSRNKRLSQQGISFVCKNLLQAAQYMHSKGIFHRDIKPQNIIVTMGHVKVCDFGWATRMVDQSLRNTYCGTPLYLSPQILQNQGYDKKVDIWAIGILAYQLFVGCAPFNIKCQQDLARIITQQIQFPPQIIPSKQFQEFLKSILDKDPQKRLSASNLLCLNFIQNYSQLQICQQLC